METVLTIFVCQFQDTLPFYDGDQPVKRGVAFYLPASIRTLAQVVFHVHFSKCGVINSILIGCRSLKKKKKVSKCDFKIGILVGTLWQFWC